jgi:hypothetical protein
VREEVGKGRDTLGGHGGIEDDLDEPREGVVLDDHYGSGDE